MISFADSSCSSSSMEKEPSPNISRAALTEILPLFIAIITSSTRYSDFLLLSLVGNKSGVMRRDDGKRTGKRHGGRGGATRDVCRRDGRQGAFFLLSDAGSSATAATIKHNVCEPVSRYGETQ